MIGHEHPCFDETARHRFGRVHVPVAAKCNVQCNYCDRRYDCAQESRPGVTSVLMSPDAAAHYVDEMVRRDSTLRVVGIAGPGDPLANPVATLGTLVKVRARHPSMLLCVATNGLALPRWADELVEVKTSHVTVTVNAVDPQVGAQMYAWVHDGGETLRGLEAAALLWERQRAGIEALVHAGVTVKINCILVPGVNEHHVAAVAERTAALGAERFNCLPLLPVPGTPFGGIEEPSVGRVMKARAACARFLPQMTHCARCRADAAGKLGVPNSPETTALLRGQATSAAPQGASATRVAVASQEGVLVNQHLGEAERLLVFEAKDGGFRLVEERETVDPGDGLERWEALAAKFSDCRALLVSGAGASPKRVLSALGLEVHETESLIDDALDWLIRQRRAPPRPAKRFKCGDACNGVGNGCA